MRDDGLVRTVGGTKCGTGLIRRSRDSRRSGGTARRRGLGQSLVVSLVLTIPIFVLRVNSRVVPTFRV